MGFSATSKWQFSLRTLLMFMCAIAAGLGLWKALGVWGLVAVAFALVSTVPVLRLRGAWWRAYLASYLAVYGPFVVMATYTLIFVPCAHCKRTTWEVLPYGPGVVPVMLAVQLLHLQQSFSAWEVFAPAIVSAGLLTGLTWVVARGGWWWPALCVGVVLCLCGYFAFVVLAIIQA